MATQGDEEEGRGSMYLPPCLVQSYWQYLYSINCESVKNGMIVLLSQSVLPLRDRNVSFCLVQWFMSVFLATGRQRLEDCVLRLVQAKS
jgi:hypothetical protein